jgi:hypothetical protein
MKLLEIFSIFFITGTWIPSVLAVEYIRLVLSLQHNIYMHMVTVAMLCGQDHSINVHQTYMLILNYFYTGAAAFCTTCLQHSGLLIHNDELWWQFGLFRSSVCYDDVIHTSMK